MNRKLFLSLVLISTSFLVSCSGDNDSGISTNTHNEVSEIDNSLDFALEDRYSFLDPLKVSDAASIRLNLQIFESLLRFDEYDLSLQPLLATSWEVNESKTKYIFHLRKGVYFHDNECFDGGKGREFNSGDVLYTFKRIYTNEESNYAYSIFKGKVAGGNKFYNDTITSFNEKELTGVKIIDDYTVEITLKQAYVSFLELVASYAGSISAHEAIDKGVVVGTGPFTYNEVNDTKEKIVLVRNNNYYLKDKAGKSLPYLESVTYNYVRSRQEQMDLFLEGKLDIVTNLPAESIKEIVNNQIADFQDKPVKYILVRYPLMSTAYINLNTTKVPFNNVKVRQAFAMAIDKEKLINLVLKGEAYGPAIHGMVSPAIKGYDYESVIGIEFNAEKAKKLLAEAGYKDGKDFPSITLLVASTNAGIRTALNIQKQLLTNLGISIEFESMTINDRLNLEKYGKMDMSFGSWLADFPDPISFLSLFDGSTVPQSLEKPSHINKTRYKNTSYDKLYNKAVATIDLKKKYEYCLEADQIIANDVPVIPLWYEENFRLIQGFVKNYQPNSMQIQYLTYVKIEQRTSDLKK